MRLIDADRLDKPIYAEEDNITGSRMSYDEICGYNDGIDIAWNKIDQATTIDAVPVVRCRECKHLNVVNCKELYAHCPKTNTVFLPFELDTREHFCSLGERKEGADND